MLSLYILQVDDTRDWRWSCGRCRGMPSLVPNMWGACNHHHHQVARCTLPSLSLVYCTINWTQTGGPVPECRSSLTAISLLLPPPLCFCAFCIWYYFCCVWFGGSWWGTSAGAGTGTGYRPVYGAISARERSSCLCGNSLLFHIICVIFLLSAFLGPMSSLDSKLTILVEAYYK